MASDALAPSSDQHELLQCLCSSINQYVFNSNRPHVLIDFLKTNTEKKGKGWLCSQGSIKGTKKNQRTVDLIPKDVKLLTLLLLTLSAVKGSEKKEVIFSAFGITRNHRTAREIAKPESFLSSIASFLQPASQTVASQTDPILAPPQPESQTVATQTDPIETPFIDPESVATPMISRDNNPLLTGRTPNISDDESSNSSRDDGVSSTRAKRVSAALFPPENNEVNDQGEPFSSPAQPMVGNRQPKRVANSQTPSFFLSPDAANRQNPRSKHRQNTPVPNAFDESNTMLDDSATSHTEAITDRTESPELIDEPLILTPNLSALEKREQKGIKIEDDVLLQGAAQKIIGKLSMKQKTFLVDLKFLDKKQKTRHSKVIVAPVPRLGKKVDEHQNAKLKACRKSAKVKALLDAISIDDIESDNIIEAYLKEYCSSSLRIVKEEDNKPLTVVEAVCIRDYVGISTNALLRFIRALKIMNGLDIFPKQLKKKIADVAREAVPMECRYVELNIGKQERKLCLFLRCTNPPLLLERMIAMLHVSGMQRPSLEVSHYKDSNLIFIGLDRGGGDTFMGIRNGNRKNGNQAEYCFPVGMVEEASEDYDNNRRTFFEEGSPISGCTKI